jgi:hypothetical protein
VGGTAAAEKPPGDVMVQLSATGVTSSRAIAQIILVNIVHLVYKHGNPIPHSLAMMGHQEGSQEKLFYHTRAGGSSAMSSDGFLLSQEWHF